MTVSVIGDNTGDDYSGTEDAQLKEGAATTNYGSNANFEVGKYDSGDYTNGLVSFSGISNLPASLTVSSAVLSLYLEGADGEGGSHTIQAKRLLRDWVEAQVTWTIWKTSNNWTSGGGESNGNDRSATLSTENTSLGTTTGQYYSFTDIAEMQSNVEDFADGTLSNYGWHLERTDAVQDQHYRVFTSSEGADGQRPYLSVTYTATGGGLSVPLIMHDRRMRYNG